MKPLHKINKHLPSNHFGTFSPFLKISEISSTPSLTKGGGGVDEGVTL